MTTAAVCGGSPFLVRRIGPQYRMPKEPVRRWPGGVTPERSEPAGMVLSFEEAEPLPALLASVGGLPRRLEQAGRWLHGGHHTGGDLLVAAGGPQRRLLDGRLTACPAELLELAVQPLPPRLIRV